MIGLFLRAALTLIDRQIPIFHRERQHGHRGVGAGPALRFAETERFAAADHIERARTRRQHADAIGRDVQLMVMAAERVGITSIVRTPGFDPAFILRLLDMGVQGIQVPHVSDPETAREAVKAVRYPPQGDRGMAAGSRAADFGKTPLLEHMAKSNREVLLARIAGQEITEVILATNPNVEGDTTAGYLERRLAPLNHQHIPPWHGGCFFEQRRGHVVNQGQVQIRRVVPVPFSRRR